MNEEKKNVKYPLQVVDVPRSNQRLTVDDFLQIITEEDGEPFLSVFSKKSIYYMSIVDFEENRSVNANIPIKDFAAIRVRTNLAEHRIFNFVNKVKLTTNNQEREAVPAAFTKLKVGSKKFAGNTPGGMLLSSKEPDKIRLELVQQKEFLKSKLEEYPNNREDLNAIEDALQHYDDGTLASLRPKGVTANEAACEEVPLKIYSPPVKYFKKIDEAGRSKCYIIKITCIPGRAYPYKVEITNFYAPLGQSANAMTPIILSQAVGKVERRVDLTEEEWLDCIYKLEENAKCMLMASYSYLRKNALNRNSRKAQ